MQPDKIFQKTINRYYQSLDKQKEHPFINYRNIRKLESKIQALEEGQRDILNTSILDVSGTNSVDKNNYKTYEAQVEASYLMYDGKKDYGSEIFQSIVDTRVAFIMGEGISFICEKNKAKEDFINNLLKYNKLNGSELLSAGLMGELEGKVLFTLTPNTEKKNIDIRLFSWRKNKYKIKRDDLDYKKVINIAYKKSNMDLKDTSIDTDSSLYLKLSGCDYNTEESSTRVHKVLTQCENASRASFDLRHNTHVFGKIFPYWETDSIESARTINKQVSARSFEIGDGYAGLAKMSLMEPSGNAAESIIKDLLLNIRYVSTMTGIPIHWLAWPELMSNRATAENLLEVISAATKKERLLWQEAILDLIDKCCQIAIDKLGMKDILEGDVTVKLPLISLAALQQINDIWVPLMQEKVVSKFTIRNMLPGIDPKKEKELIELENEEAIENNPIIKNNGLLADKTVNQDEELNKDQGENKNGFNQ
jgi:hypothetical protein